MDVSSGHLFSIRDQLVGYGAYHSHPVNVAIHRIFVPLIAWSFGIIFAVNIAPEWSYKVNDWLQFDVTLFTFYAVPSLLYYYFMEPVAALLITPQWILMYGTACAFAHRPHAFAIGLAVNVISWIFQFIGHGAAEGRSPALLDNLVGALVLAPFFVHIENLFMFGYRKDLQKSVEEGIAKAKAQFAAEAAAHAKTNGKAKAI